MIIDIHTHILPPEIIAHREAYIERDRWFAQLYSNPRARLASAHDLIASMQEAGIDRSVAFGFSFADMGLCRSCNDYVLESARQFPQQIIPFAQVNLKAKDLALAEAQRCLDLGARGFGELMPDALDLDLRESASLTALCALATSAQVPVMLHIAEQVGHSYAGKGKQGPEQAFALALRSPDTRFILAHWGGGLPFYEFMPEVRQSLSNVYYDTAASLYLYDDTIFAHVLGWAPGKIAFGSDYPLIGQRRFVQRIRAAGLSPEQAQSLFAENACTILNLSTNPLPSNRS